MFENVRNCGAGKFVSNGQWCHPDRVIDSNQMIFVTKGQVFICEDGVEYCLQPEEILILQPGLRHYGYQTSENTEFFWMHWYGGPEIARDRKYRKIINSYHISLYLRRLLDARVAPKMAEEQDYLTRLVLIELYANSQKPHIPPVVETVAAWIEANRHTPITTGQIQKNFGYNTDYLNRVFKATFAKTLKEYINHKRMEYIKELMLCHTLSLKQIAEQAGFSEYKYFLKFFAYHEKITPTEYKKQHARIYINSR